MQKGLKMLYTGSVSALKRIKRKVKLYHIMKDHGNDAVVPDQVDLDQFRSQVLTWEGFKVNYLAKLMRPEAERWMKQVSDQAVSQDVVLVSDEENSGNCYRVLLAEMMINMFSGQMKVYYKGELKV